jgi:drug/metabolite transporter (DMT)-like permease
MTRVQATLVLLIAALLEAGGDAIVRGALHRESAFARFVLFVIGGCVLFAYGWLVNSPPWNFGELLGLYVVFFFVIAQAISWIAFGQVPTRAVLLGGLLVVSGGIVIAVNQK